MSIIPKKGERLDLYEGSTFDETWTFYEDDEVTLLNLTGWSAALKVRANYDSPTALLEIASGALTPGPSAKAIVVGNAAGTLRIYVGSTLMAALNEADFTETADEEGEPVYSGVWDLELTNTASEAFRYVMGPAFFSPEATY